MRCPHVAAPLTVALFLIAAASRPLVSTAAAPTFLETNVPTARPDTDHVYRIVGKARVLFFWVSADDVGGARITRRVGENHQSMALLIGSEPARAPRGVNEWGYIREDMVGDVATIFGIRTAGDRDESLDQAEARRTEPSRMTELGVLCSTVSPLEASSRTTTVFVGRDVTYRDVDSVLDLVEKSARWKELHTAHANGIAPGFLTALDVLMRSSAASVRESGLAPKEVRVAYVYKDAVYDLIPRRIERVPVLQTKSGLFHNLLRSDISVRNRSTGSTTGFSITYGTSGALTGIPVAAVYQPNWWFKVELALDERQDVPVDPAADSSVSHRISAVCSPKSFSSRIRLPLSFLLFRM